MQLMLASSLGLISSLHSLELLNFFLFCSTIKMMRLTKQFEHLKIQLEAIKSATNNFADDNCIGNGGFGKVYKGNLVRSKGHTMVAIKRLNRVFGQGDPEFWKEIIMLSLYKHENIVSLLGFCDDNGEKILVYEYAANRSLDLYLNRDDLTWIQRLNICIGAARGLAYLHNPGGTQQRVLHRDVKSSNILLDENWNARISDLGLSKFGPANQQFTFLVSNVVGTFGYCDPLYVETGLLTKESDVYSFGVVLFEVLCGRLCIGNNDDKRRPLTGLAREYYEQNKIYEIICGSIKGEINSNSLEAFTAIAYQCLKRNLEERPLMTEVVRMLEIALEHQTMPSSAGSSSSPISIASGDVLSFDKQQLRQRLLEEGVSEAAIQDSEHIMRREFSAMQNQLMLLKQKQFLLIDTLRALETEKVDLENTVVDEIESQRLSKEVGQLGDD